MRLKVIALLVLCLVCVVSSEAQNKIQIVESDTEATFSENKLETDLLVDSSYALDSVRISLKVLNAKDEILAENQSEQKIRRGKQTIKSTLEFTNPQNDAEDLLWHRLQYEVSKADSNILSKGIISLSEIMPEMFNLKIIASKEVYAGMKYRAHILTLHPTTKKPVKDVAVTGEMVLDLNVDDDDDELKLIAEGRSNSEGFATLDFEIPLNAKLDDDGEIKIKAIKNGIIREARNYLDIPVSSFFYLHTDKPIYQPDQKLFVRGLYLNSQKKPIADRNLSVEISDDEGKTVYQTSLKTTRFGIADLEWEIPESIKLGKYEIEIENENEATIGSVEFKISRYDLPNFSVNAKPDKTFYTPDIEKAEIKVSADYLFGKSVTKGKVRIVQEKDDRNDVKQFEKQAEELDENGNFSAEFNLSEFHKRFDKKGFGYFTDIKFTAYFTDLTTNRTEEKRFDVRITKEAIHVYFTRYFSNANPALPYQFYVSTFYADGTPVSTKLEIEGNYKNIDPSQTLASAKTNSYGAGKVEIKIPPKLFPDDSEEFNILIKATDKNGKVGTYFDNIYVDEEEKQIRIYSDKTIYKPSETIFVELFSTASDDSVIVDIIDKSGVVYSKVVRLKNGKAKTRLNYRPDFEGELTLSAYSLDTDGSDEISHHWKSIIFPKATKLDFNIKSLKTVYRPNEEAHINFKVRDGKGKGVETALGIIVLDKAIEERARTERLPDNYAGIRKLLGVADSFGGITRRDLRNLDLEKRINKDYQLAAELLLIDKSFTPSIFESNTYQTNFRYIYRNYFKSQLEPFEATLIAHYEKTGEVPKNIESLKEILGENNFEFDLLKDAWGMPYRFEFDVQKKETILKLITSSADKKLRQLRKKNPMRSKNL